MSRYGFTVSNLPQTPAFDIKFRLLEHESRLFTESTLRRRSFFVVKTILAVAMQFCDKVTLSNGLKIPILGLGEYICTLALFTKSV